MNELIAVYEAIGRVTGAPCPDGWMCMGWWHTEARALQAATMVDSSGFVRTYPAVKVGEKVYLLAHASPVVFKDCEG